MVNHQKTITIVIIGVIAILFLSGLSLPRFPFAIITTTVCEENIIAYFDMDGNVFDSKILHNAVDYGIIYVPGKIGSAVEFNTTTYIHFPTIYSVNTTLMWIKDYSINSEWVFLAKVGDVNYVNGIVDNTIPIFPIGSNFGLGFNGSVDEVALYTRTLTQEEILSKYNNPQKICYTTSFEENITCKDWATQQVIGMTNGCLNYSPTDGFFPNCEYEWVSPAQYKIENNECEEYFYCVDDCIATQNCYTNLASCQDELVVVDTTTITPTTTTPIEGITSTSKTIDTQSSILNDEIFKLGEFSVTLLHLIIALCLIISIIYVSQTR